LRTVTAATAASASRDPAARVRGRTGRPPASSRASAATGSVEAPSDVDGDGDGEGVVLPRSGRAGSSASSVRATATDTGSIAVPFGYIPPRAAAPSAVRFAGASVTVTRPLRGSSPLEAKVTSGTFFPVDSGLLTSA